MLYSYTFAYIRFDACITNNQEKWHIYLQMNTKWQRKSCLNFGYKRKKATTATTRTSTLKTVISMYRYICL